MYNDSAELQRQEMDKPDGIVLLCKDETYMLHIIKGVLEENGIESMIADETIVGVYGAPYCGMGLARLLVFRRDYDKAREIVDRIQAEKNEQLRGAGIKK